MLAVSQGHIWIAAMLLRSGANVRVKDYSGTTALHLAAERDPECVELLLAHGARVNARNRDGETPLIWAARQQNLSTFLALLRHRAWVNRVDGEGRTALMAAATSTYREHDTEMVIKALVQAGARLTHRDRYGNTARSLAEETGNHNVGRLLHNLERNRLQRRLPGIE